MARCFPALRTQLNLQLKVNRSAAVRARDLACYFVPKDFVAVVWMAIIQRQSQAKPLTILPRLRPPLSNSCRGPRRQRLDRAEFPLSLLDEGQEGPCQGMSGLNPRPSQPAAHPNPAPVV